MGKKRTGLLIGLLSASLAFPAAIPAYAQEIDGSAGTPQAVIGLWEPDEELPETDEMMGLVEETAGNDASGAEEASEEVLTEDTADDVSTEEAAAEEAAGEAAEEKAVLEETTDEADAETIIMEEAADADTGGENTAAEDTVEGNADMEAADDEAPSAEEVLLPDDEEANSVNTELETAGDPMEEVPVAAAAAAKTYQVTMVYVYGQGDESTSTWEVIEGDGILLNTPQEPCNGLYFDGWYYDRAFTEEVPLVEDVWDPAYNASIHLSDQAVWYGFKPEKDTVVYSRWTAGINVTFHAGDTGFFPEDIYEFDYDYSSQYPSAYFQEEGWTHSHQRTIAAGRSLRYALLEEEFHLPAPLVPQEDGRIFEGWYLDPGCTQKVGPDYIPEGKTDLYANYAEAVTISEKKIIFGWRDQSDDEYLYSEYLCRIPKGGSIEEYRIFGDDSQYYLLQGWNTKEDGTGTAYTTDEILAMTFNSDLELYAVYKAPLKNADISGIRSMTYTGKKLTQTPVVAFGYKELRAGKDYTVSCSNNINAGKATLKIIGKGIYTGTVRKTFAIKPASQKLAVSTAASAVVQGKTTTIAVTGEQGKVRYATADPAMATVNSGGTVRGRKVGTAEITVKAAAADNYKAAEKTVKIKVLPAASAQLKTANAADGVRLGWKKVDGATGYYIYRDGTKVQTISSGDTVAWKDTAANVNGKKYKYELKAFAKGVGTSPVSKKITACFLTKNKASVQSARAGKVLVSWNGNKKADGYEIRFSASKNFASFKTRTVKDASAVSAVLSGLTSGKTVYVRIRSYKNIGDAASYSSWSAAQSVKVK